MCSLEEEEEETHQEDRSLEVSYSHSRLSKTLSEILSDKSALGYFIQFMESRGCLAIIKFWMEVECICGPYNAIEDIETSTENLGDQNDNRSEHEASSYEVEEYGAEQSRNKLCRNEAVNSNELRSNCNEPKTSNVGELSSGREKHPVSTIKQDALRIYRKYIASDLLPVNSISNEVKAEIEESLTCKNVEPLINCLSSAQKIVYKVLEDE